MEQVIALDQLSRHLLDLEVAQTDQTPLARLDRYPFIRFSSRSN